MPDQLIMYDAALTDRILSEFGGLVENKKFTLLLGTPDRAFAEFVTVTGVDPDGVIPLPRCAITIGDPIIDNERFNSAPLRKLGYVDSKKLEIYGGKFPTPINIPYTMNFWTEYQREMNLYVQRIMELWRTQYVILLVDVDTITPVPIYGTKEILLYQDGGIIDNGDLEPARKHKHLRKTFEFTARAWLWDIPDTGIAKTTSVKEILTELRDLDSQNLLDTLAVPISRILFSGDGSTTVFSGSVDASFLPIGENTLFLDATVGGNNVRVFDDGVGNLTGAGISTGTVDYVTGAITVTYTTAPDAATDITVGYFEP